jgi:hypothetical protein
MELTSLMASQKKTSPFIQGNILPHWEEGEMKHISTVTLKIKTVT